MILVSDGSLGTARSDEPEDTTSADSDDVTLAAFTDKGGNNCI
jgi:hypothetical protein